MITFKTRKGADILDHYLNSVYIENGVVKQPMLYRSHPISDSNGQAGFKFPDVFTGPGSTNSSRCALMEALNPYMKDHDYHSMVSLADKWEKISLDVIEAASMRALTLGIAGYGVGGQAQRFKGGFYFVGTGASAYWLKANANNLRTPKIFVDGDDGEGKSDVLTGTPGDCCLPMALSFNDGDLVDIYIDGDEGNGMNYGEIPVKVIRTASRISGTGGSGQLAINGGNREWETCDMETTTDASCVSSKQLRFGGGSSGSKRGFTRMKGADRVSGYAVAGSMFFVTGGTISSDGVEANTNAAAATGCFKAANGVAQTLFARLMAMFIFQDFGYGTVEGGVKDYGACAAIMAAGRASFSDATFTHPEPGKNINVSGCALTWVHPVNFTVLTTTSRHYTYDMGFTSHSVAPSDGVNSCVAVAGMGGEVKSLAAAQAKESGVVWSSSRSNALTPINNRAMMFNENGAPVITSIFDELEDILIMGGIGWATRQGKTGNVFPVLYYGERDSDEFYSWGWIDCDFNGKYLPLAFYED